ncbi:MAG: hypothetical protein HYT46_01455 [Candidatus Vogelbacteria bacterium]|nr:hypothetical protein [Candidatus Vogelbacteria bacterium]
MLKKVMMIVFLAAVIGAFLFVKQAAFAPVEIRKPALDLQWQEATSTAPWPARDAAAALVWQDKLWLMGGVNGGQGLVNNVKYWELPHYHDIWSSVDGTNWNQETGAAAWPARRSLSVVPWPVASAPGEQDRLLMLGGWSPVGGYQSDIWLSSDGVNWELATSSAAFPPREGQTLTVFQNKLWLMGGINFDKRLVYNDVWSSLDGLNWMLVASSTPWSGRYDHAVEVFQDRLWLTGGLAEGRANGEVWVSSDGQKWQLVTVKAPWGPRHGHALLNWPAPVAGSGKLDRLWLASGWDTDRNEGVSDVWFTTDGKNWLKPSSPAPWPGREDHAALIFRGELWLFAGMDAAWRWRNDVWRAKSVLAP